MEINSQRNNIQQSTTPANSAAAHPVTKQETQAKESKLSTTSTVNVSTEAKKLSAETETKSAVTPITTKEQAEESVTQFKKEAANDPSLVQSAHKNSLTSDQVSRLIG